MCKVELLKSWDRGEGFIVVSASGITFSVVTRRASYCSLASNSSSADSVRCGRGGAELRVYSLFVDIGSVGESLVSSVAMVYCEECESSGAQGGYCGSSPDSDPVDIAAEAGANRSVDWQRASRAAS